MIKNPGRFLKMHGRGVASGGGQSTRVYESARGVGVLGGVVGGAGRFLASQLLGPSMATAWR